MTTLQESPAHQVLATIAPAMPPIGTIVLQTANAVASLLPPISNANESIINVAPLEAPEHEKTLTDAEPTKTLDEYAKAINEAHQNAENADRLSKKSGREAIAAAMKAGQCLVQAKDLVGHGNWLPWLKENCKGISEKTAQRYMTLAKFDNVSDLEQCASLRQAYICSGAASPSRCDKPPEEKEAGETAKPDDATTPDIILPQMQRGFAMLQKQYDNLVKLNPKLQTHLLSVSPPGELTLLELFQRWQYPLSDAFNYFQLPSIEVVCVQCGHVREPDEYFVPIHHWSPEYKQRHEWCELCADEYQEQLNPDFDISKEILSLIENLNELKSLSAKDYNLAQKVYQLQQIKIAEPDIITAAENNVWMPTNLDNEEATVEEIRRLSPKIVIANNDETKALWNIYRHFVSSAVNNLPPTRNVRFLVVDDSKPNQPVLGIGNISGDFLALGERDKFVGWTAEQRNAGKLKHTAVGSTIIATQPFGSNFNGGKLIAALITSQAIRDEWQTLTGCLLAGMTTTSLFGIPSMYDRIKQWKRLGLTTGRVPIQPKLDIYKRWKNFLAASRAYELSELVSRDGDDSGGPVSNEKAKVLTLIFKAAGLRLCDYEHGHSRGIYFSEFYENTKDFLCGKVAESELVLKPLFQESVEQITERWREQAIRRYLKLKQEGKLNPHKQSYSQLGQMNFETAQKTFLGDSE